MATAGKRTTGTPKLGRDSNGRLMTPEEFDGVHDFDRRYAYELVRRVLVVSPFASPEERDPNEGLGAWLRVHADRQGLGPLLFKTLFEQYIRLPDGRCRADRAVWINLGRIPDPEA